jgi:hypothetical protein
VPQTAVPFALELSSQGAPVSLLEELTAQVLRHAGCTTLPGSELTEALVKATAGETFGGARRCDVQFRARDQQIEILVSAGGGRIWQTSCALPQH